MPTGLEPGGDAGSAEPSYARSIQPILAEHCWTCHGPDEAARKAGLRLDSPDGWSADRPGGAAIVPGRPADSALLARVRAADDERMPPAKHGRALTAGEIARLEAWITGGAPWESHWAYAPFRSVEPPAGVAPASARHPIDRFVRAELERDGVRPAEPADRATLCRRVYLDLIGLPPTALQLDRFLADARPEAYERLVDELLGSRHYGEHQARAWLDAARYADSHGFTIDGARSMWPWRDWVVDAINADMPFDRFTVEQLAGDRIPGATNASRVATGFHRNTQINQEGGAKDEENRTNAVLDRVNTTGAVWLGTTVDCAQCHDHKYDPITQRDYYRLFAFFNSTTDGGVRSEPSLPVADAESEAELAAFEREALRRRTVLSEAADAALPGASTWIPERATAENGPELVREPDGALRSIAHRPETSAYVLDGEGPAGARELVLEALPDRSLPAHGPGRSSSGNFVLSEIRVLVRTTSEERWRPVELGSARATFEQDTTATGGGHYPVAAAVDGDETTGWAVAPRGGEPHVARFTLFEPLPSAHALRVELVQSHGGGHVLGRLRLRFAREPSTLPSVERLDAWRAAFTAWAEHAAARPELPTVLVLEERAEPRPTHVFRRGSFLDPGERVAPGFPAALDTFEHDVEPTGRLALARWLVHPRNALAHRVTVNRAWQRFFGRGLVATENDFGSRGARPSHPDLLEWLAAEFVRRGFSRKALHRWIVTSATYQQSSRPRPALDDPRNVRLARQARLRLGAESLRDAALVASGLLVPTLGGPPVQPPQPDGVFAFTQSHKSWTPSTGPDRYRRTLYTRIWRSSTHPFLTTFDYPPANVTCTRRERSNTPLQALALANDPMLLELADGLGARMHALAGDDADRLNTGFRRALAREPSETELRLLEHHLHELRALGASEEHAWAGIARVLINLDEFITRE